MCVYLQCSSWCVTVTNIVRASVILCVCICVCVCVPSCKIRSRVRKDICIIFILRLEISFFPGVCRRRSLSLSSWVCKLCEFDSTYVKQSVKTIRNKNYRKSFHGTLSDETPPVEIARGLARESLGSAADTDSSSPSRRRGTCPKHHANVRKSISTRLRGLRKRTPEEYRRAALLHCRLARRSGTARFTAFRCVLISPNRSTLPKRPWLILSKLHAVGGKVAKLHVGRRQKPWCEIGLKIKRYSWAIRSCPIWPYSRPYAPNTNPIYFLRFYR